MGTKYPDAGPVIDVRGLRKVYAVGSERVVALANVSFTLARGEVCCLLGVSGSGKTTLLNMLAGLEKPTRGTIMLAGAPIHRMSEKKLAAFRQRHMGFVFQSYNLLPALTALENVELPMLFAGVRRKDRRRRAAQLLTAVGLGTHILHRPAQMSGGQQQRVGIARAFAAAPAVVFADEPTGNLDTKTTAEVMRIIINMVRHNNQTLILVTHNPELAGYCDRIISLMDGLITSDIYVDHSATSENNAEASV